MSMNYVEPGVYVSTETEKEKVPANNSVQMYPLLMGRIPKFVPKTLTIMRTDGAEITIDENVIKYDAIDSGYGEIQSVVSIRNVYNSSKLFSAASHCLEIVRDKATGVALGFKWYPYSAKVEYRSYPGYELMTTKPNNWDTDYTSYYTRTGDAVTTKYEYVAVAGDNIPAWTADTYYKINSDYYYPVDETKITYLGQEEYSQGGAGKIIQEAKNSMDGVKIQEYIYPSISNVDEGLVPGIGTAYKITFNFKPKQDSEYYSIQMHKGAKSVRDFYGDETYAVDYDQNGVGYNPLPVGAAILEEGGSQVFFTVGISEPEINYLKDATGKYLGEDGNVLENQNDESLRYICVDDIQTSSKYTYVTTTTNGKNAYVTVDGEIVTPILISGANCIPASKNYKIDIDASLVDYYEEALNDKCTDIEAEALYRIVPLNQGRKIANALNKHVVEFSSDEERMECSGFTSIPYTSDYISFDNYIEDVMSFAKSQDSARIITSYGSATRELSNGTEVELSTQFMLVYLAALEQIKKDGTGLTNSTIPLTTFKNLNVPKMRRTRKNEIASAGVLIFEQRPSTTEIKVRHALTTKTSDTYGKEMSVQYNIDYSRKYLRSICSPYIGRRNVNAETLELVDETIRDGLENLVKASRLTYGTIEKIGVAEDAADTIVVTLKVKVAYPLNYIYITLVLDN